MITKFKKYILSSSSCVTSSFIFWYILYSSLEPFLKQIISARFNYLKLNMRIRRTLLAFFEGDYIKDEEFIKIHLVKMNGMWLFIFKYDAKYFPKEPDFIQYIKYKIKTVTKTSGRFDESKLEDLAKLEFSLEDMDLYFQTKKYNL